MPNKGKGGTGKGRGANKGQGQQQIATASGGTMPALAGMPPQMFGEALSFWRTFRQACHDHQFYNLALGELQDINAGWWNNYHRTLERLRGQPQSTTQETVTASAGTGGAGTGGSSTGTGGASAGKSTGASTGASTSYVPTPQQLQTLNLTMHEWTGLKPQKRASLTRKLKRGAGGNQPTQAILASAQHAGSEGLQATGT